MKTNKLMHLLVVGLTLTLAGAGCKKSTSHLKPIPENPYAGPKDQGMSQLPNTSPVEQEQQEESVSNNIPTTPAEEFEGMLMDRDALAMHTVHFNFDSSAIRKDEMVNVESAVAALRLDPNAKLLVEGNCDERGTEEYNRALGERRALAVREAMAKLGIDPNRVRTISYGEDRPVDPAHNEAAWKKNRRADLVLLHPKQ